MEIEEQKMFQMILSKLEEIRCGLIDIEDEIKKSWSKNGQRPERALMDKDSKGQGD